MSNHHKTPQLRFPEFDGEWKEEKIEKHIDLLSGFAFPGEVISEDKQGTPLMRGINIAEGEVRHGDDIDRYYCGDTSHLEKYFVKAGDVVIGMDGSKVGKNSAIIKECDAGSLLVQRVARLREVNGTYLPFIYHHINSNRFHRYVDGVKTSSGIPHISAQQIKDFKILFPSYDEQKKIADFLSALDDKIEYLENELEELKTYKKGVMQAIFAAASDATDKD